MEEGIYDQLLNNKIKSYLETLNNEEFLVELETLDIEEARFYLSNYIGRVTNKALALVREEKSADESIKYQIKLCNQLIQVLKENLEEEDFNELELIEKGEVLTAIFHKINNIYALGKKDVERPNTSISKSTLFTGTENEPNLKEEFIREIKTSDEIDWLVSFIRWTGIRDLMDDLHHFTKRGGKLRIITTSYMEATDYKAIEELAKLPNTEIKVSLDKNRTRLHAKSYMFKRNSGFSTAYIGSSNLSNAAITAGLEWNLKVTERDSFDIIQKFHVTFETYWNNEEFMLLDINNAHTWERFRQSLEQEKVKEYKGNYYLDIYPFHYQQEILDSLQAERIVHNRRKNLVVAATGVGKTVISAFDFKDYFEKNPDANLLFIAHREEILEQSLHTFRQVLKDSNFGDLYVGKHEPSSLNHLFVSIQTWHSKKLKEKTSEKFYDFIIVDEVHHAPASTFDQLLTYYDPDILLGLTATPERMDGKDVVSYFENHIASEIRLTEAINEKLLSPFHYFCITDEEDLSTVKWSHGGYDIKQLTEIYTKDNSGRVDLIIRSMNKYLTDMDKVKGLGFCVSVKHAIYMANNFNERGIPSIALHGNSPNEERMRARYLLNSGEIRFIFVVDLFNEGIDIPQVDTILFLRPTESLTIFLQQLGRGLRIAPNKECLTVLDFVGQAHNNYSFEEKFRALIGRSKHSVQHYVENGFYSLPKGSIIYMEKLAKEYILRNIKSKKINKQRLLDLIKQYEWNTTKKLNLYNFLSYYNLSLSDIYGRSSKRNFSRLLYDAAVIEQYDSSYEKVFTNNVHKLFHIDSISLIQNFIKLVDGNTSVKTEYKAMLYYSFFNSPPKNLEFSNMDEGIQSLFANDQWKMEVLEILSYRKEQIHIIEKDNPFDFDVPLRPHAHYNTNQVMAAFGYYNDLQMPQFREGVKYFPDLKTDIFFITLHKSDKDFSISTQYDDYAVDNFHFHWQSQNKTGPNTSVGKRYINHEKEGGKIALFVREYKEKDGYTSPYVFLGTANYIEHEGEKPMSILWKLDIPLPSYLRSSVKKANV